MQSDHRFRASAICGLIAYADVNQAHHAVCLVALHLGVYAEASAGKGKQSQKIHKKNNTKANSQGKETKRIAP